MRSAAIALAAVLTLPAACTDSATPSAGDGGSAVDGRTAGSDAPGASATCPSRPGLAKKPTGAAACPTGVGGKPPCKWGVLVEDGCNGEWLWIGGNGGRSTTGALGTWRYTAAGAWKELPSRIRGQGAESTLAAVRRMARNLYAATANRFYRSETPSEAKADRTASATALATRLTTFASAVGRDDPPTAARAAQAAKQATALGAKLTRAPLVEDVAAARALWRTVVAMAWAATRMDPAPRSNAAAVYVPGLKSVILFGGEGPFGAYNDTWQFYAPAREWRRIDPATAPPPRSGHAMVGVGSNAYVVGGFRPRGSFSYLAGLWERLDFDVWRLDFDAAKGRWTRIRAPVAAPKTSGFPSNRIELSIDAARTTLKWHFDLISYRKKVGEIDGSVAIPGADSGTASASVAANTVAVRSLGFDPAYYEKAGGPAPSAWEARLKALPANKWVDMKAPTIHIQRDWGTTVLDAPRDQLLHWAGGHSAHCGTDVAHFSLGTGRWHILYSPEVPFEDTYSNDGSRAPTLTGRPWGAHTYASYGVDPKTNQMVWMGSHGAYALTNPSGIFIYDPATYEWSTPPAGTAAPFHAERHKTVITPTPTDLLAWGDKRKSGSGGQSGLWRFALGTRAFTGVAATDYNDRTTYPFVVYGDRHGMTYDGKRNRAYMFHFGLKNGDKAKIWSTDLKTKKVTVLTPKGAASFPAAADMGREATYLPDDDLVLVPSRAGTNKQVALIYDPATNAWLSLGGAHTLTSSGKPVPAYGVSTGVRWDAKRKLLWLVQSRGQVYAMRFDRRTATLSPLK